MRLSVFLRDCGIGSRRKVEELISRGEVRVDGKIANIQTVVDDKSKVEYKGKILRRKSSKEMIYILFNKPKGCLTTREERDKPLRTIFDVLPTLKMNYIFPVGRLDFNTTGILLLTNDGLLTNHLLHPRYMVERVYHVKVGRRLSVNELAALNSPKGVRLWGKVSKQHVRQLDDKVYEVKLWSGLKNHVKRLFQLFGIKVWSLHRLSFAGITLSGLKKGEARYLTKKEVERLFKLTGINR